MAYHEIQSRYDHLNVISVKLNADIKKAQGTGTYKGSVINAETKDGEVEQVKVAQAYLDNSYQAELKASFAAIKVGDKITVIKAKTTKLSKEAYEALSDDEKKKNANWGVKAIIQGHVVPDGMSRPQASNTGGAGAGQSYGKPKDNTGIKVGHGINGAMRYLGGKAVAESLLDTAKQVHEISLRVEEHVRKSNPKLSDYDIGASAGNAVLNALEIAGARKMALDKVEGLAIKIIEDIAAPLRDYISPKKEEKAPEPEPEEVNEQEQEQAPEDEDDSSDIPF